jgi:hypothetical protein
MVVLDGTYSHARRQLRHLDAMLAQYNAREAEADTAYVPVTLPVVKLLLGKDGEFYCVVLQCANSVLCIMYVTLGCMFICLCMYVCMHACMYVSMYVCAVRILVIQHDAVFLISVCALSCTI